MRTLCYLLLSAMLLFSSCSNVPITGRKQLTVIPSSQMLAISAESYEKVRSENHVSSNRSYLSQVNNVGQKLITAVEGYLKANGLESRVEGFDWQFTVFQSEEINAWCMPGGQIAFYEGIMPVCQDETGIAMVMGHEIAHAVARHGNERLSQQLLINMGGIALSEALKTQKEETQQLVLLAFGVGTQMGISLPYSRNHELEADELGLYFMALGGFNPERAPAFWERMQSSGDGTRPPEFLSTHPDPGRRIENLKELMPKALEFYNQSSH